MMIPLKGVWPPLPPPKRFRDNLPENSLLVGLGLGGCGWGLFEWGCSPGVPERALGPPPLPHSGSQLTNKGVGALLLAVSVAA